MYWCKRWLFFVVMLFCVPQSWGASPLVFCWNTKTNQPGLTPMAMAGCNDTPAQFLSQVATGFAHLPQAQRCLMLNGILWYPQVFTAANLKSIIENGPDCTADIRYLQLIFPQMKAKGLVPARIVLDLEAGTNTWALKPSNGTLSSVLMNYFGDSACYAKLPANIKQYTPADFDNITNNARGSAATMAWNQWQASLICQALRQTVMVTADSIFGENIPTTNYEDVLPTFTVYDLNSWPLTSAAVSGQSSPCLYLSIDGNRYIALQKDVRWNHFIDSLNTARSALRNGPVVPWISSPSNAGDGHPFIGSTWLWRQQILHLNAMGVSTYLYFNPTGSGLATDDAFASKTFQALQTVTGAATSYGPIPLDSDTVTTGTVTTRYTDFLANLAGGAGAVLK